MPAAPGVPFHGEEGDHRCTSGKSINQQPFAGPSAHTRRSAHAAPDPAHQPYPHGGRIGVLLLEAKLIRELHPLIQPEAAPQPPAVCAGMNGDRPGGLCQDIQFATESGLRGLFNSHRAALGRAAQARRPAHKLCYGALGLEKLPPGKACFRAMLHQCAGVCRVMNRRTHTASASFTALLDRRRSPPGRIRARSVWSNASPRAERISTATLSQRCPDPCAAPLVLPGAA